MNLAPGRNLPASWVVKRLDFVARVKARLGWKGLTASEYVDDGYVFLSTPNIKGRDIDFTNVNYITEQRYTESPEIMLNIGDVLLAKDGSTLGTCSVVRTLPRPATVNGSIAVVRPLSGVDPVFLFWVLSSPEMQAVMGQFKDGMGVPHLFQSDLRKFAVIVPPSDQQRAIADFLDRETAMVDDLIAKKEHLLVLLQSRQDALVRQFVVGQDLDVPKRRSGYSWLGDVPAHWKVLALKRIAKRVVVGIAEASTHAYEDAGVPLVRTTNVKANKIDTSDLLYINKQFADKNRSKYMQAGDLVTARTGNPGISGVIPAELDGSQCFTMLITTLREGQVPEFFCYYINSEPARTYFALEGWGTAQINISVPILQMLPTPCPPEKEQRQIAEKIKTSMEASEGQLNLINEAIERLREYRSSLISAAVTGQLDVRNHRPQEVAALCQ